MALPDVTALKRLLKIEHTGEDTLVAELRARALGLIQGKLQTPITAVEMTFVDEAETLRNRSGPRSLLVPKTPVDPDTLSVIDADEDAIDAADLRVDRLTGIVRYKDGSEFTNGPYTIAIEVGLDQHPLYTDVVEPIVSSALCDVVADLYHRRNPSLQSENVAAGTSRAYTLPQRIVDSLETIAQVL